ncbi:hypothetical protein AAVH_23666 [Aphelenchoides avenae]|nr:hypothetical protein AAVH_23666 [Aphelenchus avenae]
MFLVAHPVPGGAGDAPANAKNDERDAYAKIVDVVDLNKADKDRASQGTLDKSGGQARAKREDVEGVELEAEGSQPDANQLQVPAPAVEFSKLQELNVEQVGAGNVNEPKPDVGDPVLNENL